MFADAGGHVIPGANTNPTRVPGNSFFNEVTILTEGGFTPMQILQGATKWSAEMVNKGKDLGTIDAGKIADIVILNQNPLQNIAANLRSTKPGDLRRQAHRDGLPRRLHRSVPQNVRLQPAGERSAVGQGAAHGNSRRWRRAVAAEARLCLPIRPKRLSPASRPFCR